MGMILNEQTITRHLQEAHAHLAAANQEEADMTLDVLEFERLLKPIEDPSKVRMFIDPAESFGVERVNRTAYYIRKCRLDITAGLLDAALDNADRALQCWLAPKENVPS
jgi:hypothetical protein